MGMPRTRSRPKTGPISRRGQARRVRTEELFAIGETGPGKSGSTAETSIPWELEVAGMPVAVMSGERSRVSPLRWTSALDMPPVDMLAGIASQAPTGLLAFESADGLWGAAFDIVHGRIVAAMSTDEHGQVERWSATIHHRSPSRFQATDDQPLWLCLARAFLETRLLEGLRRSAEVGTQLTFLRGEVQWLGSRLEPEDGIKLDYVLMEHARQRDELAILERKMDSELAIVVPMRKPPSRAPGVEVLPSDEGDWGDLREPDELSIELWRDACAVWALCDGATSVEQTLEHSLLGRFRTMKSLVQLRDGGFIRLAPPHRDEDTSSRTATVIPLNPNAASEEAAPPKPEELDHVDTSVLASLGQYPDIARDTIEDFMGAIPDWLADLAEAITARRDEDAQALCDQIDGAATTVGARFIASLATLASNLIGDGNHRIAAELIHDLEDEYAEVFRVLVTFHATLD